MLSQHPPHYVDLGIGLSRMLSNHVRTRSSAALARRLLLRPTAAVLSCNDYLPSTSSSTNAKHCRYYHATNKQEILPLIGAAAVLFIGRYSWKALRRMDDEWDDYQWRLAQYEKQHGVVVSKDGTTKYTNGTLAVDIGTMHLYFCCKTPESSKPQVVETREGARYTFCGIVVQDEDTVIVGQRAFEQYFELPPPYQHHGITSNVQLPTADSTLIDKVLRSALTDVLDRSQVRLDQVRPVVAVPVDFEPDRTAIDAVLGESVTYIPDPVAAIWGAQQLKLLDDVETPILVVDVGGHVTTLTVVQKNVVLAHVFLKFGGETLVQQVMHYILQEMPSLQSDAYALPRVYQAAQAAAAEFNSRANAQINIPYIGMDLATKQPQHFEASMNRTVLEQLLQEHVHNVMIPNTVEQLSPHVPTPTDLQSLWTSLLTNLLEKAHLTTPPSNVLLVGGGVKHPLVAETLKSSIDFLTGSTANVVIPQIGIRSELVAMGAASILPNYSYSPNHGLVRDE